MIESDYSDFWIKDLDGKIMMQDGLPQYIDSPPAKSLDDVDRVLRSLKSKHIVEQMYKAFVESEQYEWFVTQRASAAEIPRPLKCQCISDDSRFADAYTHYAKQIGQVVKNKNVSLNESNQNGLSAILQAAQTSESLNINTYPINFRAEAGSEHVVITFNDYNQLIEFALDFMQKRQEFFK